MAKKDQRQVRIWRIAAPLGNVYAATVEHGPRKYNPHCDGCEAPCCKAPLSAILSSSEFVGKHFKFVLCPAPEYMTKFAPSNRKHHLVVTLPAVEGRCFYLNPATNRCRMWPDIPKGCQAYDCREDDRPEIRTFVKGQQWLAL